MPLAILVLSILIGLPAVAIAIIWLRIRAKERRAESYFWDVQRPLQAAGADPIDRGIYRWDRQYVKVEISINPLFRRAFTVRIAASSNSIHEFELKRGRKVEPEFAAFAPLLDRWESAGKMFSECYVAGVTAETNFVEDCRKLMELAKLPLAKTWRGGTFTYREGFEKDVPQWHWKHDLRPQLPKDVHRWCISYWQGGPLLNPVLLRVFYELVPQSRTFFISDTEDLSFLERGFDRRDIACWDTLVELKRPDLALAADLHTDGEFFSGLLVSRDLPPGFEGTMPRLFFHERAVKVLRKCDFYARRLYDDECSWFSGEYEIVSAYPLDVKGTLARIASEMDAQVMEIDRRFHKRLVVPLNW